MKRKPAPPMPALEFHELANLFPLIEGGEFLALVADVKANRLREKIWLFEGKILDGRNRYRAVRDLDSSFHPCTDPDAFVVFTGTRAEALSWVLSKNLARRHLKEGERAMVAAKVARLNVGRPGAANSANLQNLSQADAARLLKVSTRLVASAKVVQDKGAPELQRAVEQGVAAVSTAEAVAQLPQTEQAEIVAKGEGEILKAARQIMADKRERRRVERLDKIGKLSSQNAPLPEDRTYPVIYADPPWRFESGISDRSIENHYPTMSLEEICALPVAKLATRDAVLFMWVTVPHLFNAQRVLDAWGFEYKSCASWDKVDAGTGYWFFNQHEILIVATRGSFPAPDPVIKARSVLIERKGEHSAKPAFYYDMIERYTPGLARIELFSRSPREGWAAWGNQAKPPLFAEGADFGADDGAPFIAGDASPVEVPQFLISA